jgi:lysophospholipase L1-like esterase
MKIHLRKSVGIQFWLSIALTTGAMLYGNILLAQDLSINKVGTNYTIHASASADTPYTLQASEDFRLWIDLANDLTDPFSLALERPPVSSRYFRLIPSTPQPSSIRIMAYGDSLIADCCGWGAGISVYLKPNVTFANWASPGTGTKFALQESVLQTMTLVKPKYVFFEYGLYDYGTGVNAEEFENNVKALINIVRGFDGIPFLFTVQAERAWDTNGKLIPSDHPYNPITRRIAAQTNTPLIDLYEITADLYQTLGRNGTQFMIWTGNPDGLHFGPLGAVWVAQLVLKNMPGSFGPYLKDSILDLPPSP